MYTLDYNEMDELAYSGNYEINLYNKFIGLIGLSYKKGNAPKFNTDEQIKDLCNEIAIIIKNIKLSNDIVIESKKRMYTERELEQYLNVAVDLIAIIGKDGYFKKISPNWSRVLGYTQEELLSVPVEYIVHPKDIQKNTYLQEKTTNIIRCRHKDGNYIYFEWNNKYISEEEVCITTAKNITKNLDIEAEKRSLEEAMKIEVVKNEFFSNISHEFRTPINIILGTTQVINKNIEKNNIEVDDFIKYNRYIKQNSYRLLRLVNNLIDISKIDTGMYELKCSNNNIISIIEDITLSVADYTKNNNISLIFDTSDEEVITYCDSDKIERIMLNLLSNAIKYTPESGIIKVEINTNEKEVTVSVKDSGKGISKDKLNKIFDRFVQADNLTFIKGESSGIGLSLVKNLVEMHGGKIMVKSEINKGSEFIFSIPIKLGIKNNYALNDNDRKNNYVEICNIEFSDIYNI